MLGVAKRSSKREAIIRQDRRECPPETSKGKERAPQSTNTTANQPLMSTARRQTQLGTRCRWGEVFKISSNIKIMNSSAGKDLGKQSTMMPGAANWTGSSEWQSGNRMKKA